jgi:hypothetical protein
MLLRIAYCLLMRRPILYSYLLKKIFWLPTLNQLLKLNLVRFKVMLTKFSPINIKYSVICYCSFTQNSYPYTNLFQTIRFNLKQKYQLSKQNNYSSLTRTVAEENSGSWTKYKASSTTSSMIETSAKYNLILFHTVGSYRWQSKRIHFKWYFNLTSKIMLLKCSYKANLCISTDSMRGFLEFIKL